SEVSPRWMAEAALNASDARTNTTKRESPSPRGRTTRPWLAATMSSISSSCRAHATRIPSGYCRHSRTLPETSVSMKVTVPVGRSESPWPRARASEVAIGRPRYHRLVYSRSTSSQRLSNSLRIADWDGTAVAHQIEVDPFIRHMQALVQRPVGTLPDLLTSKPDSGE